MSTHVRSSMSIAFNDVNVKGGHVINLSHEKSVKVKSWQRFSRKQKTMDMRFMLVKCLF